MSEKHPLTQPLKRNNRLGNHIRPRIVKSRFVKWPRYVQIQRKKRILLRRLKVPPAVAQFFETLDKATSRKYFFYFKPLNYIKLWKNTPQKPEKKKKTD